jgi:hypothetical protein
MPTIRRLASRQRPKHAGPNSVGTGSTTWTQATGKPMSPALPEKAAGLPATHQWQLMSFLVPAGLGGDGVPQGRAAGSWARLPVPSPGYCPPSQSTPRTGQRAGAPRCRAGRVSPCRRVAPGTAIVNVRRSRRIAHFGMHGAVGAAPHARSGAVMRAPRTDRTDSSGVPAMPAAPPGRTTALDDARW